MATEVPLPLQVNRVLTAPNLLSFGRLLCVPLFLWLLFARDAPFAAAILLGTLGITDWVDGYIARRFNQVSELGKVLDPTADRILLAVAAVAIWVDGGVPDVVFWPVVVREVLVSAAVIWLAVAGAERIDVLWVGKAGAFALMIAFPCFLLAHALPASEGFWLFLAWGWVIPGVLLGYYAAYQYARMVPASLTARGGVGVVPPGSPAPKGSS